MTQTEALTLALEALESYEKSAYIKQAHPKRWANGNKAITAIKEDLAQPEQELAEAYRTELDKLSQRNYELRMENAKLKAQPEQEPVANNMTTKRAVYFMERFKREEKLLGPNEQAALDFVISMLEAHPEQEPAWYHAECDDPDHSGFFKEAIDAVTQVNEHGGFVTQLYTTPPQRTWVGLTDYQIEMTWFKHHDAEGYLRNPNQEGWAYEKELMTKLKEKNT